MAAEGWKYFETIEEIEDMPTGINATHAISRNGSCLYDLQGRRLANKPTKGVFIQNGKKVMAVVK